MRIKLADGETVDLSAAQVKTLRAAGRGNLRYYPPRDWARASSERTRFMFEIDGQKGKATIPGTALYREPLDLIDLADPDRYCTAAVNGRGWRVLNELNKDKWTVYSHNPNATGRTPFPATQDWGVLNTEADAAALAAWMTTQWTGQNGWTYEAKPIPLGTEPGQPHELWLSKAGVR